MRHLGLLIARVVFGSYLAVHGAQKLFGSFNGPGPDTVGSFFEQIGLRPGKPMAYLAGASELAGGVLTATGVADPLGPIILAGTMAVASSTHRKQGPLAQNGGFELPLTNMAMAIALMSSGSGHLRLGPHAPRSLRRLALVGGIVLAGVALFQILSFKNESTRLGEIDETPSEDLSRSDT